MPPMLKLKKEIDIDGDEMPSTVAEAPAAPVVAEVVPPPVVASPVVTETVIAPLASEDKLFRVRPRATIMSCSIGGRRWSFKAGVEIKVPENVKNFLAERNLI